VVLPRQIQALAQMEQRFVAVAAGGSHALALTATGALYGWGAANANGHERDTHTPHRVAALIGECVKFVAAGPGASCAVTEQGELFTWSARGSSHHLGHGVDTPQATPKRVDALVGVRVAAVAIGGCHTLAADEDGVVWAFGEEHGALGLDAPEREDDDVVLTPAPIPKLRVRALKSP